MTNAKPKVLAIDDTPANLLTLGAALGVDYDLQIATSGAAGLALAAETTPDLILLDVMMPEMDGYETCRRLKLAPRLRSIPVIFVTALGDSHAESVGLALGAADYISKPINVEIARQRIGNLLEREQLRMQVEAQRDRLEQLVTELQLAAEGLEEEVLERTADLRAMAKALLAAEARERAAISIDLHDDLGQDLAIAKFKLGALGVPGEGQAREPLLKDLKEVEALLDRCNRSVRSLSSQLSPPVLHQFGLGPALEWLSAEVQRIYGLNVNLHLGKQATLDETTAATLYRIVRELLINISKHAQVREAEVIMSMDAESGNLEISVADDGVGFDVAQTLYSKPLTHSSYGLFSIKQRIDFLGGRMWIDSHAGHGTIVLITLAVAPAEPKTLTERSGP